jgi:hypothetical protein
MDYKMAKRIALLLFFLMLVPTTSVLADMGPKPHMEFEFTHEGTETLIVSGTLYECGEPDCSDAQPLEEVAVQGFYCYQGTSCSAVAYGFRPYHQLEITFDDGRTLQSNVFETVGFISNYTVTVRATDLLVEERFDFADFLRNIFNSVCCFGAGIAMLPLALVFIPSPRGERDRVRAKIKK